MLGWHRLSLFLCTLVQFAAGAPFSRQSHNALQARDVIVNVGDVTTVKKVISTAFPTTIYVPFTVSGEVTTVASVSTAIREVTLVSTATAVTTKLVRTVVTEGVTQTAIVTTTAFNVQVNPVAFVTGPPVTVYQPSTVVQTVQGVPVTSVVTVMQTKAAEAPSREKDPKETGEDSTHGSDKTRDDTAADTHTQQSAPSWAASALSPTPTSTPSVGGDNSLTANNTAVADSEAGATVDSSNINTNNVTVVSGGPVEETKNWLEENKWIAIGVGCAIILLVIVGIVAIVVGGKSHSASGPPAQQSVVLSAPSAAPAMRSVAAQPVLNSLARPSRRRYAAVGGEDSSAMSSSSGAEDLKQQRTNIRRAGSTPAAGQVRTSGRRR